MACFYYLWQFILGCYTSLFDKLSGILFLGFLLVAVDIITCAQLNFKCAFKIAPPLPPSLLYDTPLGVFLPKTPCIPVSTVYITDLYMWRYQPYVLFSERGRRHFINQMKLSRTCSVETDGCIFVFYGLDFTYALLCCDLKGKWNVCCSQHEVNFKRQHHVF